MKDVSINATVPENKDHDQIGPFTIILKEPETIQEANSLGITDEVILANAYSKDHVAVQGMMRRYMRKGLSASDVQAKLATHKLGMPAQRLDAVDPQTAFINKFRVSSPEEQAKMLAAIKSLTEGNNPTA